MGRNRKKYIRKLWKVRLNIFREKKPNKNNESYYS